MKRLSRWIRRLVDNPYAKLLVGVILLVTGLHEAWATLRADLIHLNLKAHHGVMVLGLFHILTAIPDLLEAAEDLSEDEED